VILLNEAILDFTADDFREVFHYSIFDFLNENGINLYRIEDVFARYQENKYAQSINMALSMVIERIVDKFLLSQNVLKEEELGTELDSDFSIQVNPSTSKPCISSKYKLLYKGKNLKFIFDCQFDLNEIYYNEKVDSIIRKITEDLRNQLSE
jgi:hypothetical protein